MFVDYALSTSTSALIENGVGEGLPCEFTNSVNEQVPKKLRILLEQFLASMSSGSCHKPEECVEIQQALKLRNE